MQQGIKTKLQNKWLKILQLGLFGGLWLLLYFLVKQKTSLEAAAFYQYFERLDFSSYGILSIALILVGLNWTLETLKWQVLLSPAYAIGFLQALKGVLAGLGLALLGPQFLGDIAGRVLMLPAGNRGAAAGGVMLGSIIQTVVTLVFGCWGVFFLFQQLSPSVLVNLAYIAISIVVVASLIVFVWRKYASHWRERLSGFWKNLYDAIYSFPANLFNKVVLLAIGRYLVFIIQYLLIFYAFKVDLSISIMLGGISWVFLIKTIFPVLNAPGDLGLRELSAVFYFDFFGVDPLVIIITGLCVWCMNVLLPTLPGIFFTLQLKFRAS